MKNVLKRCVTVLAFTFLLITMGTTRLKASDLDTLNYTNGFAVCPIGGCASVNLLINSSTSATITVTSLLNGYQFDNFGFNYNGTVTINPVTGLSSPLSSLAARGGTTFS